MADLSSQYNSLADLIAKQSFLQGGGGEKNSLDKINTIIGTVGQMKTDWDSRVTQKLENAKKELENKKLAQETQMVNIPLGVKSPDMLNYLQKRAVENAPKQAILPKGETEDTALASIDRVLSTMPKDNPNYQILLDKKNEIVGAKTLKGQAEEERIGLEGDIAKRKEVMAEQGLPKDFQGTLGQAKDIVTTRATSSLYPLRQAQASNLRANISNKTLGEIFPNLDDTKIKEQFGQLVDRSTPYTVALNIGKMNVQKSRQEKMFPVSALSPEGQSAAFRAGLGEFIPESTARIINGANPIKIPSFEETTSQATSRSIEDKINQVANLLPEVKDSALGFGKYQINKFGQYVPGFSSDPNVVDFYTNINSINNAMIYYMSGKQINEQESKRIKSELLEPELNPDAFQARLKSVVNNFNYLKSLKDQAISGTGKRNPFEGETTGSKAQTTAPKKQGSLLNTLINEHSGKGE